MIDLTTLQLTGYECTKGMSISVISGTFFNGISIEKTKCMIDSSIEWLNSIIS